MTMTLSFRPVSMVKPQRFGATASSATNCQEPVFSLAFVKPIIEGLKGLDDQARREAFQFFQTLSLALNVPAAAAQQKPVVGMMIGPYRDVLHLKVIERLREQGRPMLILDASARGGRNPKLIQQLVTQGLAGQPSLNAMLAEGKPPVIIVQDAENLSAQAKQDLVSLMDGQPVAGETLKLRGVTMLVTVNGESASASDRALLSHAKATLAV